MIGYGARSWILLFSALLFLTSCAGLPSLETLKGERLNKTVSACRDVFPQGKWQFAHVIGATLPGGGEARLMGVTEVSSNSERIHAVMMTIEGLVLFDALSDGKLTINRGVAPFDSLNFAKGLMDDIRLIFFRPAGASVNAGLTQDGFQVCRYRVSKDGVVDVMIRPKGKFDIEKYENGRLVRKVVVHSNDMRVPQRVTLKAYGAAGYQLNLKLISAEQINR